mgnify:CR=1 FL=1
MKVIHKPRRAGKTYDSLKYCSENNILLVCANKQEAMRVMSDAKHHGFDIKKPVTFDDIIGTRGLVGSKDNIFIENADLLIEYIFNRSPVSGISITAED